jgi:hypothetical protein
MNSNENEYRRQAAGAENEARSARSELDRAAWLRVAQGWLSLLRKRPQSDEEAFDAQTKAKGTGQDDCGDPCCRRLDRGARQAAKPAGQHLAEVRRSDNG